MLRNFINISTFINMIVYNVESNYRINKLSNKQQQTSITHLLKCMQLQYS